MTIKELLDALYEDVTSDPSLENHEVYVRPLGEDALKAIDVGYDSDMDLIIDAGGYDNE